MSVPLIILASAWMYIMKTFNSVGLCNNIKKNAPLRYPQQMASYLNFFSDSWLFCMTSVNALVDYELTAFEYILAIHLYRNKAFHYTYKFNIN